MDEMAPLFQKFTTSPFIIPTGEIRSLTALRGIAALAVVLQHYSAGAETWSGARIPSLAPHGYMAVDFFFVLSGFIMAYNYADTFRTLGWRAFPHFLTRRVARIWPMQAAMVVALCAIGLVLEAWMGRWVLFQSDNLTLDAIINLLMLQGLGLGNNLNGPSATVSQEVAAYILFPLLLWFALHRNRWVTAAALILATSVVVREAALLPHLSLALRELGDMLPRCFAEFTLGLLAFRLFVGGQLPLLASNQAAAGLAAAAAGSLTLGYDLPAALLFPWIVVAFAKNSGSPARLASARWPYFLGVVSYSLYLVHDPMRFLQFAVLHAIAPGPFSAATALIVAFCSALTPIPIAWLAYRWIERPGRNLLRRRMVPTSRQTADASAHPKKILA